MGDSFADDRNLSGCKPQSNPTALRQEEPEEPRNARSLGDA